MLRFESLWKVSLKSRGIGTIIHFGFLIELLSVIESSMLCIFYACLTCACFRCIKYQVDLVTHENYQDELELLSPIHDALPFWQASQQNSLFYAFATQGLHTVIIYD